MLLWNKATISLSSINRSRSVVSEKECGRVSLQISRGASEWTVKTSSGHALGKLVVYDKWSSNVGQLSGIAGVVPGPFLIIFLM